MLSLAGIRLNRLETGNGYSRIMPDFTRSLDHSSLAVTVLECESSSAVESQTLTLDHDWSHAEIGKN